MTLDMQPNRLSPVHERHQDLHARFVYQAGWQIPEVYTNPEEESTTLRDRVVLADISARGKLILKGIKADEIINAKFGETPTIPGDVIGSRSNSILIARLTTDEFFILTQPGAGKEVANSLETEIATQKDFASLIDQTSGMVGLLISGPMSTEVMRKLCALDFSPKIFFDLHVAQSSFAKVRTTIIRHNQEDVPTFELYADRSYAIYLWDTILDAGLEFGIQPVGWKATEFLHGQI